MSDKIGVTLSSTALEVNAGDSVEFTATIHNRSQIVDQFTIGLEGVDPTWYELSVASVSLFPGDKDEVKITIHPPKTAETKAGSYPFTVKAVSGADPQEFTAAEASLEVHTFAELSVEMSPTRVVGQSGTYVITLNNQGNADITRNFEASDPEEGLSYTFNPREITVPAGGSATVQLSARLKKKPKVEGEGEKEYPFQVVIKPTEADKFSPEAKTLNGQLVYEYKARAKPKIPWWLIAVIAVVAAVIIGLLLLRGCAVSPPKILSFGYEPADHGYTLLWVTEGAIEGDINGEPIEEAQLGNGTMMADPAETVTYVLTVRNRAGLKSHKVIIPPLIDFNAEFVEGEFKLTWSARGAIVVQVMDGTVDLEGSKLVAPNETTEYVLAAENKGGKIEESLTLTPAAVTVASPNEGEEWVIGSQHSITWTTIEPAIDGSPVEPVIQSVRLEYSSNGGKTWRLLSTTDPQATFSWIIPNTPSATCLVRATIYSTEGDILDQDISDAFFTIKAEGEVELLTPEEGELLKANGRYYVSWDSWGAGIDHISLACRVEGGSWWTVVSNYSDTGSYLWVVPNYEHARCSMRIVIYDPAGNELDSDINGPFLISGGQLPSS